MQYSREGMNAAESCGNTGRSCSCIVSPVYVRVVIIVVINDGSRRTPGLNTPDCYTDPRRSHTITQQILNSRAGQIQKLGRTNTKARPDKYKSIPDRAEPCCLQCRDREPSRIRCLFVYDPAQYVYLSLVGHWPIAVSHQKTGQ